MEQINKMYDNSKLPSGEWNGKSLFLCGYSFQGFIEDPEQRKKMRKKFDYIYDNCKHWGFFGDGLCFSCHYEGEKCPFDEMTVEEIEKLVDKNGN